jgi:FixJ family two-component response regulator
MIQSTEMVYVLNSDPRVRQHLSKLLSSSNLDSTLFKSVSQYLDADKPDVPSCLVLDFSLRDIDRLQLKSRDIEQRHPCIIVVGAQGDIRSCVNAMRWGVADFLTRPLNEEEFLQSVRTALERDAVQRCQRSVFAKLENRYKALPPGREKFCPSWFAGCYVA